MRQPAQHSDIVSEKRKGISEELTLKIIAKAETWVEIKIDKHSSFDLLFKKGDVKEWKANQSFNLFIGNAAGLDIIFNDKKYTQLGKFGQVIRLKFPPGPE